MSDNFRTAAVTLRSYVTDPYLLIEASDAVVAAFCDETPTTQKTQAEFTRDALVQKALTTPTVFAALLVGKKINAIKELRAVSNAGLKESKDAVEDHRVEDHLFNIRDILRDTYGVYVP